MSFRILSHRIEVVDADGIILTIPATTIKSIKPDVVTRTIRVFYGEAGLCFRIGPDSGLTDVEFLLICASLAKFGFKIDLLAD